MSRKYFGTDGVRGVFGEFLTPDLVERLGRAATLWSRAERVKIGRDTRGSGLELEAALARGVESAGAVAVLAGVLPTPAVALDPCDLGCVISASHNPPAYNGVKFFDRNGEKLVDAQEEEIEALLEAAPIGGGAVEVVEGAATRYVDYVVSRFGTDLAGRTFVVDCANGAYSHIAPEAFRRLGADVHAIGAEPDGSNINSGCGATELALLQQTVRERRAELGIAFDGDGDRMLAVDHEGNVVDGDQIVAILALHLGVELVAVTSMTNLGFHRLMADRGIRVITTDVGDRYVLEALRAERGVLGGEQSGHIIYLRDHVTGDGLAAALLLCAATSERSLADAAAAMERYPQVKNNVSVTRREVSPEVAAEVEKLNAELAGRGRVLVRPSGTEPVIRVLAEAPSEEEASDLCGRVSALVAQQLG